MTLLKLNGIKKPLSASAHQRAVEMNKIFPKAILVENETSLIWKKIKATFGVTWTNTNNESKEGSCSITLENLICDKDSGLVKFTKCSILSSAVKSFSEKFAQEQGQGLFGSVVSIQSVVFEVAGAHHISDTISAKKLDVEKQIPPFTFNYDNVESTYFLKSLNSNLELMPYTENN